MNVAERQRAGASCSRPNWYRASTLSAMRSAYSAPEMAPPAGAVKLLPEGEPGS